MDAFHLKGLRQILKITTTFIEREHTNAYVYKKACEAIAFKKKPKTKKRKHADRKPKKEKKIIPVSQTIQHRAIKLLGHIIREHQNEPTRQATLKKHSVRPNVHRRKRVGRPRILWTQHIAEKAWLNIRDLFRKPGVSLDLDKACHRRILFQGAQERWF